MGWLDQALRAEADVVQSDGPGAFSDAAYYEAECRDWSWSTSDAEDRANQLAAVRAPTVVLRSTIDGRRR